MLGVGMTIKELVGMQITTIFYWPKEFSRIEELTCKNIIYVYFNKIQ